MNTEILSVSYLEYYKNLIYSNADMAKFFKK